MRKLIQISAGTLLLTIMATTYFQQRAISSILLTQGIEMIHDAQMWTELNALKREVSDLKHERARRLDHVARQVDLLIAMRRGGRAAKKLLADRKVRFYLGI